MKTIRLAALTVVATLFAPLLHAAVPAVTVRISPAPAVYGQPVTINVSVQGSGAAPTGSVTLRRGAGAPLLDAAKLDASGNAQLKTTFFAATGDRSEPNVEVTYLGDTNYDTAVVSQRHTVLPAGTRITLTSSANPSPSDRPLTLGGTVSVVAPAAGPVTFGTVTFSANGRNLGMSNVTNGTIAPLTISDLTSGSQTITGRFSAGDVRSTPDFQPSSTTLVQDVVQGSTINASARVNERSTTIDVTVAPSGDGVVPFGTVRFSEGTTTYGTTQLNASGHTSMTLENLGYGTHEMTVTYLGNGRFAGASTTISFTINDNTPRVASVILDEGQEGRTAVELTVTLPTVATEAVSFGYATVDGAAVAGDDYASATGVVTFAAGERQKSIALEIFGDRRPEANEQFVVRFSAARGVTPPADAQITIRDDDPSFVNTRDITYATMDGEPLLLDLRVPSEGRGPYPIVMIIDAEDWASPNSRSDAGNFLTARGIAVATVGFRSSLQAPFPAQLNDVRTALQWLRTHASDYNLQASRVGVWGIGAGGHLASLLGTTDPTILGVVDWYGQTDLVQLQSDVTTCADHVSASSPAAILLGCAPATCPTTAAAANPLATITRDDPPFLIMHGTLDCLVPSAQSRLLHDALTAAGARSSLTMVDAGRGGAAWQRGAVTEPVAQFFVTQLKAPATRNRAVTR
jgi:acetyl esterase/lipase